MNIKGFSQFASSKTPKERKPVNKRRLRYGSLATGLTALFIAAVVLINVVVTMLFERFPMALDLTGNSIFTVSEETANYIKGITSPVEITVMADEDDYRSISEYARQCAELLSNYSRYNSLITVRYKDLLSNPDFVANYSNQIATGDIIVELGESDHTRVKIVTPADIINVAEENEIYLSAYTKANGGLYAHQLFNSYGYIVSSNAEQALTGAIMAVTDANPITVCTLSYPGANEADVTGLTELLDKNGYVLTELDIRTDDIPEDVDIIIIPAPKIDYTEAETAKITDWLTNGGSLGRDLIYVASAAQGETPNLDALLYKYGLTVEPKVIYETNTNYYSSVPNNTFQSMVSENYRKDIANQQLSLVVPNARPISTRFGSEGGYNTCEALVASSLSAVTRDMYDTSEEWSADNAGERGSFNSVVLGRYKALNQDTHISTYTNVIAIGSEVMLDSTLMSAAQFNNGDFFLSLINELSGKTEGVTIVPKKLKAKGVLVSDSVKNSMNLAFAVIIPAVVLATGTAVWLRRRHR